jgi:hypothetical protein
MKLFPNSPLTRRVALVALALPICASGPCFSAAAVPNELRWDGHAAVLQHAVAWQQEDRDGRWVTFVLLTDRPVPPAMLTDTKALDPNQVSQDKEIPRTIGAQALLFPVMTGGIPVPDGKTTQQAYYIWYRDGKLVSSSRISGRGGMDIEILTPSRIKGRTVEGRAGEDSAWSVSFDVPITGGNAARMAAQGEALGQDGGPPGKHLVAALEAMRKKDYAALKDYASPDLAEYLKDAGKRDKSMALLQSNAGDSQQIVNGLRTGDQASVYWVKKYNNSKIRTTRCTDTMKLAAGTWRSVESNCWTE